MGTRIPSDGLHLYIFSLSVTMRSRCSLNGGACTLDACLYQLTMLFHASCFWSVTKIVSMASPASLTILCMSSRKYLWNFRCAYLTSCVLVLCARFSTCQLSASLQVSWDIHYTRAFDGCGVLVTTLLSSKKASTPLVWGCAYFGWIDQRFHPVSSESYVVPPLPLAPPGSSYSPYHGVIIASPRW